MSWYGNRIRHSLAARGIRIRRKPLPNVYNVQGLESLVGSVIEEDRIGVPKDASRVTDVGVKFYDWEIVISKQGEKGERLTPRELMAAPAFVLGFARDGKYGEVAYVFVGRGGTFTHPPNKANPKGWRDNYYMQPVAYHGPAIMQPRPVELHALSEETGTGKMVEIPFAIAGFVGLENRIVEELVGRDRSVKGHQAARQQGAYAGV